MWKEILRNIAPVIGGAIGGPFGLIATSVLKADLLGQKEASDEELEKAIVNASPETLAKIRKIDASFKVRMEELGVQKKQLHQQDRSNAREMAAKTTMLPQMIISGVYILAFAWVLHTVFTMTVTLTDTQLVIVNMLIGILSAGLIQIMNFWFGSSSGSKQKTTHLSKAGGV